MLHDRRHGVVFVALGIVGKSLADLVDRIDVEPLCQAVEIQAPVFRAVGGIVGPKMTAMKKHDDRTVAFFEIASADTVNVDILFVCHGNVSFRALRYSVG
jgi:hypothetical protein